VQHERLCHSGVAERRLGAFVEQDHLPVLGLGSGSGLGLGLGLGSGSGSGLGLGITCPCSLP
jgi:hypothetical protein